MSRGVGKEAQGPGPRNHRRDSESSSLYDRVWGSRTVTTARGNPESPRREGEGAQPPASRGTGGVGNRRDPELDGEACGGGEGRRARKMCANPWRKGR